MDSNQNAVSARTPFSGTRDPYLAFRYPDFRRYLLASLLLSIAQLIQEVAVGYELYQLTHDALALGLTGLVEAVPFIGLSLYGGHVADRLSKRRIIIVSVGCVLLCSLALCLFAQFTGSAHSVPLIVAIYAVIFLIGINRAFYSPAAYALRAHLVPVAAYENSSTWSSSSWQAGSIVGPALGGFFYSWAGFANTLAIVVLLIGLGLALFARMKEQQIQPQAPPSNLLKSMKEGIGFVTHTKIILYAISLDLFSVLFGGVMAILPIFAVDILHVGAQGLGLLRAAPSVGAVVTLLLLARVSVIDHAWRNLLVSVGAFGVSILIFALSPWMWLASLALFMSGAFDSVSVVIRSTLLQLLTPDEMRGRVMAVNGIFISSSNELGAFESGVAARIMGTIPSVLFGGTMTLLTVGYVYARSRELLKENRWPLRPDAAENNNARR